MSEETEDARQGSALEKAVWDELRTVFDPEIPVNIADLGLIYSCRVVPLHGEASRVEIKMTLTAPGCGMSEVIKAEIVHKVSALPRVNEVAVEVVFDPPWNPGCISEAAKLQLGLDLDFGTPTSQLPILKSGS